MHLRAADSQDSEALADFAARTFEAAFAHDNDPRDMAEYVGSNFNPETLRAEIADPAARFLVLEEDHSIIGYLKLHQGEAPAGVKQPNTIELVRIYVDPERLGQKLGAKLMRAAVEMARSLGAASLWLGVWENNTRAIAFYEKWGFKKVGAHDFVLGKERQTDWIMEKIL